MKNTLLIIIFFCLSNSLLAQLALEKDYIIFRPGDCLIKQEVKNIDPGSSGPAVVWDFSNCQLAGNEHIVSYSGNDSIVVCREQRSLYKYNFRNDSLFHHGFENQTTLIDFHTPEISFVFPVEYTDSISSYYHGTGNYCEKTNLTISGFFSYHADAYGIIILPGEKISERVLRIHSVKKQVEHYIPNYSAIKPDSILHIESIKNNLARKESLLQTDSYKFYIEGYRYPVFEFIEKKMFRNGEVLLAQKVAYYYSPEEQYYSLDNDPENQQIRESIVAGKNKAENNQKENSPIQIKNGIDEEKDIFQYKSYRNENGDILIDYFLSESARVSILIFDMQGRQLMELINAEQEKGQYVIPFSLSSYRQGQYLLRINVGEEVYGEIITN